MSEAEAATDFTDYGDRILALAYMKDQLGLLDDHKKYDLNKVPIKLVDFWNWLRRVGHDYHLSLNFLSS